MQSQSSLIPTQAKETGGLIVNVTLCPLLNLLREESNDFLYALRLSPLFRQSINGQKFLPVFFKHIMRHDNDERARFLFPAFELLWEWSMTAKINLN